MALMLRMCCFSVEVTQYGPTQGLPFNCFEIYGLGGLVPPKIRREQLFEPLKNVFLNLHRIIFNDKDVK